MVRNCEPAKQCTTFDVVDDDPESAAGGRPALASRPATSNGPTAGTSVVTWGAVTGLRMWHSSTITFARAGVAAWRSRVARFATPVTVTAYDGSRVDRGDRDDDVPPRGFPRPWC